MVDDHTEDSHPPDPARARREPPTIDLEASEVTEKSPPEGPGELEQDPEPKPSPQPAKPVRSTGLIAALCGAAAAAVVIAAAWLAGWPAAPAAPPSPATNSAAVDDLARRLASVEAAVAKPASAVADPVIAGRLDALEKSRAAGRGELDALRDRIDKLAAEFDGVKKAPAEATPAPDLSAINERIAGLEAALRAQKAAIAEVAVPAVAKPADDVPLRRIVAATLLDVVVRVGDPFPAALKAAKSLAPDPEALKPLEAFAVSGLPNPATLSRELLNLVPKLSPAPTHPDPASGVVERLQAGVARLVRIERTDAKGSDTGSVVARVTAAALRNDLTEARRELNTLAPADRAPVQGWIEKADARDAALAASRQFAAESMALLARPAP